ncbi:MAG TPA: Hsp70 family protein, partial [Chitinophagaceae bacterium]|nr:Hsp70 family protein [Chitinophagaceae bacterium]
IPPAPRGMPQIEVVFDIDANGILHVTAKDKGTGKEQKIRIEAGSGLTKEEIEKMKNDAKMNEASDKAEKEKIEKLNLADSLVFQTEKQLKEYGEKIPADKKTTIETAVAKLKEAHKAQDLPAIETATTELNNAWTAASQDIYNAQQQPGGAQQPGADAGGAGQQQQPGSGNGSNAENVQDVPFEEVK